MVACLELGNPWLPVRDGDPRALDLYRRHYSAKRVSIARRHCGIGGPGERMILLTVTCDALWVWRRRQERLAQNCRGYDDGQRGVMCGVFRNEGPILSSLLVKAACVLAWQRWPAARLFTYVDSDKVASRNPGYCFKQAGWRTCGKTKGGLWILELEVG